METLTAVISTGSDANISLIVIGTRAYMRQRLVIPSSLIHSRVRAQGLFLYSLQVFPRTAPIIIKHRPWASI
jgi:hypothetical protein